MDRIELLKNMMVMAAIDGKFTESEFRLLAERATVWGLDPEQFQRAVANAVQPEAEFTIPPTEGERLEMLSELIQMMAADGRLDEREKSFLASATVAMGISTEQLNQLVDQLLADSPEFLDR